MSDKKDHNHDESTVIFTDIGKQLQAPEEEVADKPACLLAVGGDLNGELFDLFEGETRLGREVSNQISLDFPGVSRAHLIIEIAGDKTILKDLGSKNGTYYNNRKVEGQVELFKGDIIKIGAIALKYIPQGDPERLAYDKLNHEAHTDGLTGCYNKTHYMGVSDKEVKKCKITGSPLSLLLFDLDHFKHLNDTYGHDAGDFVLKRVAEIVRGGGVRDQDIFSRYGGEEFTILLPKTNIKQAFEIAERIRKLISDHDFNYEDQTLPVSISVGVADYRQGVENGTDLFKRADKALYVSKDQGRNRVNFFRA